MLEFKNESGELMRPGFKCVEEMNELIRQNHNAVVKNADVVFWMGDITMWTGDGFHEFFRTLNGQPQLILGNHDDIKKIGWLFSKIHVWRVFKNDGFTLSHIPIHPASLKTQFNVHGHTHANSLADKRYINICPEIVGYRPIDLAEIKDMCK